MTLWILGHIGWIASQIGKAEVSWVQWHTMFSLCGGLGTLVAFLSRPHRGARENITGAAAVELATYGMFGAFVFAYFVLVPSVVLPSANNSEGVLLWLVQVQRLLLMTALTAAVWAGRRTSWSLTYKRLAFGVAVGFFLRVATSLAISRNDYHLGHSKHCALHRRWSLADYDGKNKAGHER